MGSFDNQASESEINLRGYLLNDEGYNTQSCPSEKGVKVLSEPMLYGNAQFWSRVLNFSALLFAYHMTISACRN